MKMGRHSNPDRKELEYQLKFDFVCYMELKSRIAAGKQWNEAKLDVGELLGISDRRVVDRYVAAKQREEDQSESLRTTRLKKPRKPL
jgi:hypothetical protein